jgi:folate-binding protein YgfZ
MANDDNCRMSDDGFSVDCFDGAVALTDWGVIRAQGPDAAPFLHGQLTQDLMHLDAGHARLAGYCSAKGRLLATFVLWRPSDDEVLLACSADLLPATLKRLSMFVLRAKCELADVSSQRPLCGLVGASADAWLGAGAASGDWTAARRGNATLIRLPTADGHSRALCIDGDPASLPALDLAAWRWLEVRSGVPRVAAATADQFVPQMLNLELLGGVDFKKGCYPGQEVVARSQYRGTLKRRTYLMASSAALAAGMEVFHSADPGQPAGMVVLAASLPDSRHAAQVAVKIAALEGGELRAANGAQLSPTPLPYPLDALVA